VILSSESLITNPDDKPSCHPVSGETPQIGSIIRKFFLCFAVSPSTILYPQLMNRSILVPCALTVEVHTQMATKMKDKK
jgi:hypothetical protein